MAQQADSGAPTFLRVGAVDCRSTLRPQSPTHSEKPLSRSSCEHSETLCSVGWVLILFVGHCYNTKQLYHSRPPLGLPAAAAASCRSPAARTHTRTSSGQSAASAYSERLVMQQLRRARTCIGKWDVGSLCSFGVSLRPSGVRWELKAREGQARIQHATRARRTTHATGCATSCHIHACTRSPAQPSASVMRPSSVKSSAGRCPTGSLAKDTWMRDGNGCALKGGANTAVDDGHVTRLLANTQPASTHLEVAEAGRAGG